MAATININCVLSDMVNIASILQELRNNKLDVKVDKKISMDNWSWENQQEFQDVSEIYRLLQNNKIIVINAHLHTFKDFGIYVERCKNKYFYEFWINTDGFPELDSDVINSQNIIFFEKIQYFIINFVEKHVGRFEIISIGNETLFKYKENIAETIQESDSVLIWMIPKVSENEIRVRGYSKKNVGGVEVFIKNN